MSKIANEAIVRNLRFAFKDKVAHIPDDTLVKIYDDFAMSEYWGNNDTLFLDYIRDCYPEWVQA